MIRKVIIKNFLGFEDFSVSEFSPITVIIGKNDTGKTGLLKLLYAICKSIDNYSLRQKGDEAPFKKVLAEKMLNTFQPRKGGLGALVSKGAKEKLAVDIKFDQSRLKYTESIYFSFGDATTSTISDCSEGINVISSPYNQFRCLFIPAKEVLTALAAIRATRDNLLMAGFDDTYLDLIRSLTLKNVQGDITKEFKSVNKMMEDLFEGRIEQVLEDDDFIFKKGNSEFSMQLTAEGIKKIGILTTLIRNRQLNGNTVLFMDEPETALHPSAIRQLVKMIVEMSKAGVQIFLSTHSYFVIKQLQIEAKIQKKDISCISLEREKGAPVRASISNLQYEFPENSIIDESLEMFNEDINSSLKI
jgi:AAA15 family ATPase/GTPase